ncbi:MAG: hypothetical protein A2017_06565 [Lentisphaerae bacterium GWF2_44_16]|nr:MAG: hypothetical protein A2017_06565 [Lentisphaerae bacterium GWF2_44_16]
MENENTSQGTHDQTAAEEQNVSQQTENKHDGKSEKTVPLSVLLKEREKRQEYENRLKELEAGNNSSSAPDGFPEFKLDKKDMLDLTPEELQSKINSHLGEHVKHVKDFVQKTVQKEMSAQEGKSKAERQIDAEMGKYDIFNKCKNEDPYLYDFALNRLSDSIQKDKEKSLADIIKDIAKDCSRRFVKKADEQSGDKGEDTPVIIPPANSAAEVAHMKEIKDLKNRSFKDLRADATKFLSGAANSLLAKGKKT